MGNEMDNTSKASNGRSVRGLFARARRGIVTVWDIGAILFGVLATGFLILSVAEYYTYISSTVLDGITYGEFGVFAFLAAAVAVGLEVVARRHHH